MMAGLVLFVVVIRIAIGIIVLRENAYLRCTEPEAILSMTC